MKACIPSVVLGFRGMEGASQVQSTRAPKRPGRRAFGAMGYVCGWILCAALLGTPSIGLAQAMRGLSQTATPSSMGIPGMSPAEIQAQLDALQKARAGRSVYDTMEQEVTEPNEPNDRKIAPFQKPVEEELSRIEQLLTRRASFDVNDISKDLRQFGYEVFRSSATTFAPVTNVPVGPDYVIGPGDGFTITLWGRVDAQYPVQVDRNGQIVLPEVGALRVWGMKFGELETYLQHELSRKYTDFRMSLVMGRLRTVQVFVVGEAARPGTYTISSLSTVINALFAAGGPSRNGTMRKVRLARSGQEPSEIDLYSFLMGGDKSKDVRLQDGDTIFIPLIGPVVGVAGNVKRPAIYEMTAPMTLGQVLDQAGGVTFAGWLQRVQVERVEDHRRRIVVDCDLSKGDASADRPQALDTMVQDGDVVKVFAVAGVEQNIVQLQGHVSRPGKYEWKPGMRLSDLVDSYNAVRPQPNTDYAQIERLVPPDLHAIMIPFNLGQLLAGDAAQDLELAQYDTIRLFKWDERPSQSVTISGMVFDPSDYRLVPDMKVRDLVDIAGGLQKNAYLRTAEITRRHISQEGMVTEKIDVDLEKALAGDPNHNLPLRDYDHIVVRPIPDLAFGLSAEVLGEVRFPGTYPIRKGETLSSLIERAGGYTDQAYLRGAVFTRESAKVVQRHRLEELIRQVEESMLSGAQERMGAALDADAAKTEEVALETRKALVARLRAAEITGRVVVRLKSLEEFKGSPYDLELENGDTLTIPQMPGVVHVVGEVFNATSLLYEDDGTVGYYLNRVGGMTKEADKKQVSVIKADGTVVSVAQGNRGKLLFWDPQTNSWSFGGFMSRRMEPGDTIVVPRKIDKYLHLRMTKDITQIIFQIAVAAGVVFAI